MATNIVSILLGALCTLSCAGAGEDDAASAALPWGQDVHVFGSTLVDLDRGFFRFGPFRRQLNDCSNDAYFCLTGLEIVLPRTCGEYDPGTVWEASGVRTVVLNKRRRDLRIHEGPPDAFRYVYLLATEGHPWLVFEYEAEVGIIALFMDTTQPIGAMRPLDIRGIAMDGEIEALRFGEYFSSRITERVFGACSLFR